MSASSQIAYFGYGSLVNLDSLRTPYISAHRARLTGWRRTWLSRPKVENSFAPIDGLAFLSVELSPETVIEGLIIVDHRASLPSLDEREALYRRVPLEKNAIEFLDGGPPGGIADMFLYCAENVQAGPDAHILRSYLDVVMQGYEAHFGERGLSEFIATTSNFDCPILEDRHDPVYPRAVALNASQQARFDGLLR